MGDSWGKKMGDLHKLKVVLSCEYSEKRRETDLNATSRDLSEKKYSPRGI